MSTKVGGIPEILPGDMMILAEPSVSDLIEKVKLAISRHKKNDKKDPIETHNQIEKMYNWRDVARRTEIVYDRVMSIKETDQGIGAKLIKFLIFLLYHGGVKKFNFYTRPMRYILMFFVKNSKNVRALESIDF